MELTDRLSTLPRTEQLKVMERAFQKMSCFFGNQMIAKWEGLDIQMVYGEWADELKNCSIDQIKCGIELSKEEKHPPNLGEFLDLCKRYKPENVLALDHKLTAEQIEENKRKVKEIMEQQRRRFTQWKSTVDEPI